MSQRSPFGNEVYSCLRFQGSPTSLSTLALMVVRNLNTCPEMPVAHAGLGSNNNPAVPVQGW